MHQLVKSIVNWNIYNDNIMTSFVAQLKNSRSSLTHSSLRFERDNSHHLSSGCSSQSVHFCQFIHISWKQRQNNKHYYYFTPSYYHGRSVIGLKNQKQPFLSSLSNCTTTKRGKGYDEICLVMRVFQ